MVPMNHYNDHFFFHFALIRLERVQLMKFWYLGNLLQNDRLSNGITGYLNYAHLSSIFVHFHLPRTKSRVSGIKSVSIYSVTIFTVYNIYFVCINRQAYETIICRKF